MRAIEKVAEMAKTKSWREIIERYILPEVLKKSGSARGYKISDEYMEVVAEYTQIIRQKDVKMAELLLELAMQRISCGAVPHRYVGVAVSVPLKYVYYSAFDDKPAPMSNACFDFLVRGFPYAVVSNSEKLKRHASAILFGLIFNLDYQTGEPKNGLDLSCINTTSLEVRDWAWQTALDLIPFEEFWKKLVADGWIKYRHFFVENWYKINIAEFHRTLVAYVPPQKAWPDLALDSWERHIGFFHDYWPAVDTKSFFELIGVTSLAQKAKISLKIKCYRP